MRRELKNILLLIALVLAMAVVAVIVVNNAKAEALFSQDAAHLLSLTGDMRLSEAPVEFRLAECLRVDVVSISNDGVWGDLTLPYVPPSILGAALFDGFHICYGVWQQVGETTLRLRFWPEDVARLDGTVGIYLIILIGGDDV